MLGVILLLGNGTQGPKYLISLLCVVGNISNLT